MINRYVSSGMKRVEGWLSPLDAKITCAISAFQVSQGFSGSVGEIGVHHGKLFILLYLLRQEGEKGLALDLFSHQDQNVDHSGKGDREKFEANMLEYAKSMDGVEILEGNSLQLKWADLSQYVPSFRLLSIDGGHTAECASNDLAIAEDALAEGGIVLLDDYFNCEFPAVSEGFSQFSHARPNSLVPFAIGDNKLLLCKTKYRAIFGDALRNENPQQHYIKDAEFYGCEIPIFKTPRLLYDRIKRNPMTNLIRNTGFGNALKPAVRRLFG